MGQHVELVAVSMESILTQSFVPNPSTGDSGASIIQGRDPRILKKRSPGC